MDLLKDEITADIFESVCSGCMAWVTDAHNALKRMNKSEIVAYSPILDKFTKGMYLATNAFFGSDTTYDSVNEIKEIDKGLNMIAYAFYSALNEKYSVPSGKLPSLTSLDSLDCSKQDVNLEIIASLNGVDNLTDAFQMFTVLEYDDKYALYGLVGPVLRSIYETTKCLSKHPEFDVDENYSKALDTLVDTFELKIEN